MMNPVFRISRQAAKVVEKVLFENFEKNAVQLVARGIGKYYEKPCISSI